MFNQKDMYTLLKKAIYKTSQKYSDRSMAGSLTYAFGKYIEQLKIDNPERGIVLFSTIFTRDETVKKIKVTKGDSSYVVEKNVSIRDDLLSYAVDNNKDLVLEFINLVNLYVDRKYTSNNYGNDELAHILRYKALYSELTRNGDLESNRESIYMNPVRLEPVFDELKYFLPDFVASLKPRNEMKKSFEPKPIDKKVITVESVGPKPDNGIRITQITDTAKQRIYKESAPRIQSNVYYGNIVPSFNAVCKEGRITMASSIGYGYEFLEREVDRREFLERRTNQDAVLSMEKDGYILNIVADGMGGSTNGQVASMKIVKDFAKWFRDLDLSILPKSYEEVSGDKVENNNIYNMVTEKLKEINDELASNEETRKSGSTVVIGLTTPEYSMFINVGDSTAYAYDANYANGGKLTPLTTTDAAPGIDQRIVDDYELFRNHPFNNIISACIGDGRDSDNIVPHAHVIKHDRPIKIIMSSDGVTDLVSERSLKTMLRNNYDASDIVRTAAVSPDEHRPASGLYDMPSTKYRDNISAIVIDIPEEITKGGRRR